MTLLLSAILCANPAFGATMSSSGYKTSGGDIAASDSAVSASASYNNTGNISGQMLAAGVPGAGLTSKGKPVQQAELIRAATIDRPANGVLDPESTTGIPTISDAIIVLAFAMKAAVPTTAEILHADVAPLVHGVPQPDGKIDLGDVIVILRRVVGLTNW